MTRVNSPFFVNNNFAPQSPLGSMLLQFVNSTPDKRELALRDAQIAAAEAMARERNAAASLDEGKLGAMRGFDPANPMAAAPWVARGADDLVQGLSRFRAIEPGLSPEDRAVFQQGFGMDYGKTEPGFGAEQARISADSRYDANAAAAASRYSADRRYAADVYAVDNKPIAAMDVNGPIYVSQSDAIARGMPAVLAENEARGAAFQRLPAELQALATGPTATETQGSLLARNFDNLGSLAPQQLAALSAEPKIDARQPFNVEWLDANGAPRNALSFDGRTDVNGTPLPPTARRVDASRTASGSEALTNSQRGNVALDLVAYDDFRDLLGRARSIAQQDATIFGATGNIRRFAQSVTQQLGNIGMLSPQGASSLDAAYKEALANAAADGVDISLLGGYDPNLNDIGKLSTLMTYTGAAVFAGQQGRSVSDKDVQQFSKLVGDPTAWGSTQPAFLSGLDLMESMLDTREGRRRQVVGGGAPAPARQQPAQAPASPQPGEILHGYRFRGGDPADPTSWEPVQ